MTYFISSIPLPAHSPPYQCWKPCLQYKRQDSASSIIIGSLSVLVQLLLSPQVMLALGGWSFGSKPFQDLVSNQYRMNGFVYDSLEFLRKHEFDGLDIDWEVRGRESGRRETGQS